jgi:hypothetical protein
MTTMLDDLMSKLSEAEARALEDHRLGRCHLSEWSCSYCEAEEAARGNQAPCPAWCDGSHPDPGGVGNVAHVRANNGVRLEWVTNENGRRRAVEVRWAGIGAQYFGPEGLRQLAEDARLLALKVEEFISLADLSDPEPTL